MTQPNRPRTIGLLETPDVARLWGVPIEFAEIIEFRAIGKFQERLREACRDLAVDFFGEGFKSDTAPPPKVRKIPVRKKREPPPPPPVVPPPPVSRADEIAGRIMARGWTARPHDTEAE